MRKIVFTLAILLLAQSAENTWAKSGKKHYSAYLFTYFEGSGDIDTQEQLRYAISTDATTWYSLNNNEPIVDAKNFAESGSLRDPHILRCEDGKTFYMVATDMCAMKNGWDYNPGIILMKSTDLIHWESTAINVGKTYPEKFGNAKWMWAPQTIYDRETGKYMVYFSAHWPDNSYGFYYAYANKDFTGFESEPQLLFHPVSVGIDADIVEKDGVYHFFFKDETTKGIRQALGTSLHGPFVTQEEYFDPYKTSEGVEGPCTFPLNDGSGYIMMFDVYHKKRFEFVRSTDLMHFTSTPETFTKNFNPRHGTIIGITSKELKRLKKAFNFQKFNTPAIHRCGEEIPVK